MAKVAVYTIALNEEQFVARWYRSAKEADYLLIADTGSTDRTVSMAKKLGIEVIDVRVRPWRFDDARNAALAALPDDVDYCIALDMDEVLLPGWKKSLDDLLAAGVTRVRYQYTWSWNENGTPGLQYGGDKIHARRGYRWRHPVHEVLTAYGDVAEVQGWTDQLFIEHHPDNAKSRGQYLPMLKMAVDEDPRDDRNAFYYARELYFYGQHAAATAEFKRHLELPGATWAPERAASMRYLAKMNPAEADEWFQRAIAECSNRREGYVDYAHHAYTIGDWPMCYEMATGALEITERPLEYITEAHAWDHTPHDLAALGSFHTGKIYEAILHGRAAVDLAPPSELARLTANLRFYEEALSSEG